MSPASCATCDLPACFDVKRRQKTTKLSDATFFCNPTQKLTAESSNLVFNLQDAQAATAIWFVFLHHGLSANVLPVGLVGR